MKEAITKEEYKALSMPAQALLSATFGGIFGNATTTYRLRENGPGDTAEAGLIELISKGIISAKPFNSHGGVVLKGIKTAPAGVRPPNRDQMKTVVTSRPLKDEAEGAAIGKRLLAAMPKEKNDEGK